jgi:ferredoxin
MTTKSTAKIYQVTVLLEGETRVLYLVEGANLRKSLLEAGLSPYTKITKRLNCGGRGLCATCGVLIQEGSTAPQHWHDKLAHKFGYPRLSCQVTISSDMTLKMISDKLIWGKRQKI